jgi:hypothetical protein
MAQPPAQQNAESSMLDLTYLALGLAGFAIFALAVRAAKRM